MKFLNNMRATPKLQLIVAGFSLASGAAAGIIATLDLGTEAYGAAAPALAAVAVAGLGVFAARLAMRPLREVFARIDAIRRGDTDSASDPTGAIEDFGVIGDALSEIGVKLRNAERSGDAADMLTGGLDSSAFALMMADADHNITYVNEAFRKLARRYIDAFREVNPSFDPDDVVGKSIHIFHKNPAHQKAILADPSRFPMTTGFEIGGIRVGLNLNCVRDGGGRITGFVVTWEEATERMKTESTLKALRDNQIMLEYDMSGRVTFANRQMLERLETQAEEVVGKSFDQLLANVSRDDDICVGFVGLMKKGGAFTHKIARKSRSGKRIWVDSTFNPIIGADGKPFSYVEIGTDVTETEELARKNSATLNAIGATQAMIEFTPKGEVIKINENFTAAMGYEPKDIVGRHHSLLMPPEDRDSRAYREHWEALGRGELMSGVMRRIAKDGSDRYLQCFYTPVVSADGKVERVVKTASDDTAAQLAKIAADKRKAEEDEARARVVQVLGGALGRLADGDLSDRIERAFPEEYEALRADFNRAQDALGDVIRSVIDKSTGIGGGASEVNHAADDLARRTESQAAALEETVAALKQLTESLKTAADNAADAGKFTSAAAKDAKESDAIVQRSLEAMKKIEASSQQIAQIIGVIDDIAFQTNLLAINAGVEAARAGEAGRGFAVVATEVRALAQRCTDAAKEIKDLISASTEQVEDGVSLVTEAGGALEKINGQVARTNEIVVGIASSTQEQSQGVNEIMAAMDQLDEVTQRNAAMVEEMTAASHELTADSRELGDLVTRFKVSQDSADSWDHADTGRAVA